MVLLNKENPDIAKTQTQQTIQPFKHLHAIAEFEVLQNSLNLLVYLVFYKCF